MVLMLAVAVLTGCSGYNKIVKASDYNTKYNLAKSLFLEGRYTTCSSVLEECVVYQRGTAQAEESMYLLATCYYNLEDYLSASQYYLACYRSFPNSVYSESCLYYSGRSLFFDGGRFAYDPARMRELGIRSVRGPRAATDAFLEHFAREGNIRGC